MGVLGKQKKFVCIAIAFFFLGFLSGAAAYAQLEGMIPKMMEGVYRGIISETSKPATALNIIKRNATATLALILTGVTVVTPFLIVYFNGFFMGLGIRYVLAMGLPLSTIAKGVIPHGVFELFAFFWAAGLGIELGFAVVNAALKKNFGGVKQNIKESLKTYVRFILPLVAIAGIIETYVSATLLGV